MSSAGVLAIELSQRQGGIALQARPGGEVHVRPVPPGSDERDELMPAIDALVRETGCGPRDIGLVCVSIGPGGFTGLRVGVATAKALSLGLGAAVIGVPSGLVAARAVAARHGIDDGTLGIALAVKGESVWYECVRIAAGVPCARTCGLRQEPADLAGLAALVADEFLPESWVRHAAAQGVRVLAPEWCAAACLREGVRTLAADGPADPLRLEPLYPRPAEAVTLWSARKQATPAGGTA